MEVSGSQSALSINVCILLSMLMFAFHTFHHPHPPTRGPTVRQIIRSSVRPRISGGALNAARISGVFHRMRILDLPHSGTIQTLPAALIDMRKCILFTVFSTTLSTQRSKRKRQNARPVGLTQAVDTLNRKLVPEVMNT